MIKFSTQEAIDIKASTIIISFPSEGSSPAFCLSLLTSNYHFTSIGYYYSEYCSQAISYCPKSSSLFFNGEVFFNSEAQLSLINFRSSAISVYQDKFHAELIAFIKDKEFKNVIILGSISKHNMNDFEIQSRNVNVYHISNNDSFNYDASSILNFKNVFPVENRTKTYEEMKYVEGCSAAKKFIQALVLEKMKFLFIFAFSDQLFDPLSGFCIYNKIESLLQLKKDNLVTLPKKNLGIREVLSEIAKSIKVDSKWDVYTME